jgi:hypothetical protein
MSGIIAAAGVTAAAGIGSTLLANKGSGGTQTQTQQQQLPDWMQNAAMWNYGDATQASYNLMPPYPGQRVADQTPGMVQDINALQNNVGSTQPWYQAAQNQTNALMGYNPSMISPQSLASTSLQPYMNPFTQSVIDPSMQLLNQQRMQGLNQIGDQAAANKAFGGSRQGVAEGVTNAQSALQAGQLGAQLWGQNFNQAQTAATGDITRNLTAQQNNQQYGLLGAQFQGQMANQLGNLATQGQNAYLTGLQNAMVGQQSLQQQQQAQLDAARQYYTEQQQYPLQQLQIRQSALSGSPYGTTSQTTGPGPSTNPMLSGLGTAATVAGLAGQFGLLNKNNSNAVAQSNNPANTPFWNQLSGQMAADGTFVP